MKRSGRMMMLCVCALPAVGAWANGPLEELALSGTWARPADQADAPAGWEVAEDRLAITAPLETAGEWWVQRLEPLPDEGWTLDFAGLDLSQWGTMDVALVIGDPARGAHHAIVEFGGQASRGGVSVRVFGPRMAPFTAGDALKAGAGRVQWVRMTYNPEDHQVRMWLNGQPVPSRGGEAVMPTGPVAFRAKCGPSNRPMKYEVRSFTVTPFVEAAPPSVVGVAWQGWSGDAVADALQASPQVLDVLRSLASDEGITTESRSHALAAWAVYDYATTGAVGPACWAEVERLGGYYVQHDPQAATALLPILAACGNEAQRAQVRAWTEALLDDLSRILRRSGINRARIAGRLSLLDPARAFLEAPLENLSLPETRSRAEAVRAAHPELALALWAALASGREDRAWRLSSAWLLPELSDISPSFGTLLLDSIRDYATHEHEQPERRDHALSLAAYRIAPTDPATAMELWGLMTTPSLRAEALELVVDAMPAERREGLDALVEQHLREAVTQWEPRGRRDSPVHEMLHLARWLTDRERAQEAAEVLRDTTGRLGERPELRCSDLRRIARMMAQLELPEAEAVLQRAMEEAIAFDAEYDGPETGGGIIYLAPTEQLVSDLVAADRVEEALALAQTLDPDRLPMNRGNAYARIIRRIAQDDMPRALQLLEQVDYPRTRSSLTAWLILRLVETDREAAEGLLETLPEDRRSTLRLRIARASGDPLSEELLGLWAEAAQSMIQRLGTRQGKWAVVGADVRELAELPVDVVLGLTDYFAEDRDLWAHLLLASVVHAAGLAEDPLWARYDETFSFQPWTKPWGGSRLVDAVRAEQQDAAASGR